MTAATRRRSGRRGLWWAAVLVMVLTVGAATSWAAWRYLHQEQGQTMSIPHDDLDDQAAWPTRSRSAANPAGPPFLSSVSPDGRYFMDQYSRPILVRGDSPWGLMTRLSAEQAELWFAERQRHGVNAAIVSLIGTTANGGPSDDGGTFDGLRPFVDGDPLRWQEPYWKRVKAYLRMAADHGITVMLYPIDGWTIGHSFVPASIRTCRRYGAMVAQRFADLTNIVWMSGGDYFPAANDRARGSDVDHCFDALMRGIRETGDNRLFSIQLGYDKSISTENPYWASRVDWNFVYTYHPTYQAVLEAYGHRPAIPAVLGEANYEGENNQPRSAPTTNETLRRQVLWALTSGAAGEFAGSDDWEFHDGWERRLSTPALAQITRLRKYFSTLPWWELVPDTASELVTAGRGIELRSDEPKDVLDNDYVTAARTPDGKLATIYVPTSRTITVDLSTLPDRTRATWLDPASGATKPVPMAANFTTPGANADGDQDWLLVLTS